MAQFLISAFADEAGDSLEQQIEALRRNGIRCIEPRNVNGGLIKKSEEELEEIAKKLREAGISVSSLGSPVGKYKIDEDFAIHLEDFRRALRACKILGTKYMRMFSFFVLQERLAECRDEVLRRMGIMLDMAKEEGIILCHENEARIYGQNPNEVRDLIESFPDLRGIFDAANFVREKQDPIEGIKATLPSLEYLHIKDARFEDRAIVPCGMGDGQYAEVLRRVDGLTDRVVYLTVEPHLYAFQAYQKIDSHKLKTGLVFENGDDAFDCAVKALKDMLTALGYHEGEDKIWRK